MSVALGRYQLFIDGKSESDAQILDRLIDQWIVRNEANAARYPQLSDEEVQRSLARLKRSFSSPAEFEDRRRQSGLSSEELQAMVKSQLYLSITWTQGFGPQSRSKKKMWKSFTKSGWCRGRKSEARHHQHLKPRVISFRKRWYSGRSMSKPTVG